ncbi:MAG: hypothetical protein ACKVY0_30545 [Prosthecobacter sp.]|uniref:hypothetical protein n=1 Tax=Prosthecobacter sp. TaxID=1965333 RepID=UPI003902B789
MKTSLVLHTVASFLAFSVVTNAQSDTAHHRAVYNAINAKEDSLKKVTATHKDEPTVFALTGWLEGGEVKKIVAKSGDDGDGVTEYYLEGGMPLFVFNTYSKGSASKAGARVEERLYFKDGSIFKWLTNEKPAPVFHGEDYQATTELYTTNCEAFVAALKNGKTAGNAKAAAKLTDGVFLGIEEGDYAHWNMRTVAGDEVSYFILKPDASVDKVLEQPKAFIGKKCRVTWKKSTENIPEAGGKMEIEQILSVEWLGKK